MFIWSSAASALACVQPWRYTFRIIRTSDNFVQVQGTQLSDTVFVPPITLDANTSYRWDVTASLSAVDTVHTNSFGTFVILDLNSPRATVLYHNFPNPFPTAQLAKTCIRSTCA